MLSAFGVEHGEISKEFFGRERKKNKQKKASLGRLTAGTLAGGSGIHGAIAGKKGHKLRAMGNQIGGGLAAGLPATMVAGPVAGLPATLVGANIGTRRAQAMGHFKKQKRS